MKKVTTKRKLEITEQVKNLTDSNGTPINILDTYKHINFSIEKDCIVGVIAPNFGRNKKENVLTFS